MPPTLTGGSGAPGKSIPTGTCVGACHGETGEALVCNCCVIACITGASKDEAIVNGLWYPTVDGCMKKTNSSGWLDEWNQKTHGPHLKKKGNSYIFRLYVIMSMNNVWMCVCGITLSACMLWVCYVRCVCACVYECTHVCMHETECVHVCELLFVQACKDCMSHFLLCLLLQVGRRLMFHFPPKSQRMMISASLANSSWAKAYPVLHERVTSDPWWVSWLDTVMLSVSVIAGQAVT